MEKLNGHHQENLVRDSRTAALGRRHSYGCYVCICLIPLLTGCGTLKSSLLTGAVTSGSVLATSVFPGGVIVPTIAAGVTSATASALTAGKSSKGEPLSVTADTVVHKAPDNLFTMLGNLISVGGIGLILFLAATYLIPLLMGYLIPNGFERKKKSKK